MLLKISTPNNSYSVKEKNLTPILNIFKLDENNSSKTISKDVLLNIIGEFENWLKDVIPEIKKDDIPTLGSAPVNIMGEEVTLNVYQNNYHEFIYEMCLLLNEIKDLNSNENIVLEIIS